MASTSSSSTTPPVVATSAPKLSANTTGAYYRNRNNMRNTYNYPSYALYLNTYEPGIPFCSCCPKN